MKTMKKATVFAPGHISGFFQPIYHENIYQTGSRGAGINLSSGATSTVQIDNGAEQKIDVFYQKKRQKADVVTYAIRELLKERTFHVVVDICIDLPISQGFGISAASALSSSYALATLLQIPYENVYMAAHKAEIVMKTGLGDVAAEIAGGVEIRKKPGIPPWGQIEKIAGERKIVICTIDKKISTSDILNNTDIQKRVQLFGKKCTDALISNPTFENFFQLSTDFTYNSKLASEKVLEAMDAVKPFGMCSMCMLGNTVFSVGKTEKIIDVLSEYGTVQKCDIDQHGVQILK
ncbi:hypothetical protein B6U98_00465 [Thermoplasmatales archaeon ex4572_165]|nr:MAG: hypothetical protein B6U98_00465 [Thermoplasmatales archaeon ex4572_165]RLF59455.1 MAG: hypothetical protein DRN27_02580 [Thermoplasmata archaeon]